MDPSTLLDWLQPANRGERLEAVGWIESRVRQVEQLELLLDLVTRSDTNLLRCRGG